MNSNTKALKSGVWYTFSNFLLRSIGLITTPIFTRLLTKEEFGLYSNYTSWLLIATVFVTLCIESTLISARYDYSERFDEYIFSVLGLSTASAVFWLIIVNIFRDFFCAWWNIDMKYINAMLIYLLFYQPVVLFQARSRYYFEYKKSVIISMIIAIGTSLLSIILVMTMSNRLSGRIYGSIIPTIILGVVFFVFFFRKGKRIDIRCWKYALPICIPYIPHLLSLNILNAMDKTMITEWCGPSDNALYSLAYTCGSLITMLATSVNSAYAPWLGEKLAINTENSIGEIRRFSKIYIGSFLGLAIGIMAITPELLYLLGGKQYIEAKYVLAPISTGCVCQFLYTMFVNIEQFRKKTVGMAIASIIAATINFILNSFFIPRVGYLAAAYTTLFGYICLLCIHMFLVKRMGMSCVYSYKFIVLMLVASIGILLMMTVLYSINIIRYLFIIFYALALVLIIINNRKVLLNAIRKWKHGN